MDSIELVMEDEAPWPMAIMETTEATPMTMPSMVNAVRSLFEAKLSTASFKNFQLFILHSPIQYMYDAFGLRGDFWVMRDQDQRHFFLLV